MDDSGFFSDAPPPYIRGIPPLSSAGQGGYSYWGTDFSESDCFKANQDQPWK